MRAWTRSIKAKTLLTIAVVMAIIVGSADQFELWRNKSERQQLLVARASLVASIQADALVQPVWDLAIDQVRAMVMALARDPDFLAAEVLDGAGKAIAKVGKFEPGNFVEEKRDLLQGTPKKSIGQLVLRLSTARLEGAATAELQFGLLKLVIMLGVIMGAIYAALRLITTPLDRMTAIMSRLADGGIDVVIPATERGDEIGAMARAVSVFKTNAIARVRLEQEQVELKKAAESERRDTMNSLASIFEEKVRSVVSTARSAGRQLEETAVTMQSSSGDVCQRVEIVMKASDQATCNVHAVAAAAEQLSCSISEIGRRVADSAVITSQAVDEADRTNVSVEGLARAAQRIGDVVQLINKIASQTNLLALNATIEAARAGESGRGFAVVANEVKALAGQTARATEEIASQVTAIQAATKTSVSAIQGISKTIAQIDFIATEIANSVQQQSQATQEIAQNVQAAAHGTEQVSVNIGGVGQGVQQTGLAASIVREASQMLSEQFGHLNGELDDFLDCIKMA